MEWIGNFGLCALNMILYLLESSVSLRRTTPSLLQIIFEFENSEEIVDDVNVVISNFIYFIKLEL
jgi:hypothetical protein